MKRRIVAVCGTTALLLCVSAAVRAEPPSGNQACAVPCVKQLRLCSNVARATFKTCLDPCKPLRDAVAAQCGTDFEETVPTPECAAALAALQTCTGPCRDGFKRDSRACVLAGVQCLRASCSHHAPPATPTPNVQ